MKYYKLKTSILLAGALLIVESCSVFQTKQIIDPNSPGVETVLSNATASQLDQLGIGVQSTMRNGFANLRLVAGSIGREV